MSDDGFTTQEKLDVVEGLIVAHRAFRSQPGTDGHEAWRALKAIAVDLRAGLADAGRKIGPLEEQIERARRSRAQLGYLDVGHSQALAEGLIAHWPLIRAAFDRALRVDELCAHNELLEMMVHDVSAPEIVAEICATFPALAARWKQGDSQ